MSTAFYLLCPLSLGLTTPKPRAQVLGYKTPLFLANWQCVLRCFGRWFHSTHARPLAVCPFSKCPASSCLEGESGLFEYPHRVDFVCRETVRCHVGQGLYMVSLVGN